MGRGEQFHHTVPDAVHSLKCPSQDDMHAVVGIHNSVNERAWREVRAPLHIHTCSFTSYLRLPSFPYPGCGIIEPSLM